MTTAMSNETARVIYQCKNKECKHIWAFDYRVVSRFAAGRTVYKLLRLAEVKGVINYVDESHDARCPKCKTVRVQGSLVEGCYSEKHLCDSRCTNAKGPHCDCSCGGANHGSAYL